METKQIAFWGMEYYDIIINLACIIAYTNKRILIIDLSDNLSLKYSIQQPEDLEIGLFTTRIPNVDYTQLYESKKLLLYDYVFVYFGRRVDECDMKEFDVTILLLDQQIYNVLQFNQTKFKSKMILLTINEAIDYKIGTTYLENQLNQKVESSFLIHIDDVNKIQRLNYLYNQKISIRKFSGEYRKMIFEIAKVLSFDCEPKKLIKKAFKAVKRGRFQS